jgi:hypothetical protein
MWNYYLDKTQLTITFLPQIFNLTLSVPCIKFLKQKIMLKSSFHISRNISPLILWQFTIVIYSFHQQSYSTTPSYLSILNALRTGNNFMRIYHFCKLLQKQSWETHVHMALFPEPTSSATHFPPSDWCHYNKYLIEFVILLKYTQNLSPIKLLRCLEILPCKK